LDQTRAACARVRDVVAQAIRPEGSAAVGGAKNTNLAKRRSADADRTEADATLAGMLGWVVSTLARVSSKMKL
jgi:hypothetical protein